MNASATTSTGISRPAPSAPSAPVTGWRPVFADSLMTGGATAVCHALGAVTSLLLRCWLSPAQMGLWQGLKLFLSYGNYAGLGASKGAARELAAARGSGNLAAARQGLHLAFTFNTITSTAYAVLLAAAALIIAYQAGTWRTAWSVGLLVVAALTVLQRYVTFRVTILRAEQAFRATALLAVWEAVVTLLAAGTATWLWGLPGLYVGTCAVLLSSWLFLHLAAPWKLCWAWDGARIGRLLAIGAPILLAGVVSSLLRSLDKLMILAYLPDREYQLGCYSLALMVGAQVYGVGNMFSTVMGPRYCELMGRSGDPRTVALLAARASHLQAAVVGMVSSVAILAGIPLLSWLLPEYRAGLPALVWILPGVVALCVALPASQYLVAVDRHKRIVPVTAAGVLAAAAANHWALTHGGSLAGVAVATSIAYLVYAGLIVRVSLWPQLTIGERAGYVGGLALVIGATTALAVGMELWLPWSATDPADTAIKLVVAACGWGVLVFAGVRWGAWAELWGKPS